MKELEQLGGIISAQLQGYLDSRGITSEITMYDADGTTVTDANDARRWYVREWDGMVIWAEDEEPNAIIFEKSPTMPLKQFNNFRKALRDIANKYSMMFRVRSNFKQHELRTAEDTDEDKTMTNVSEARMSKLYGSTKTSYQDIGDVKVLIRHRAPVDEGVRGSRSRNIKAIFFEHNGERIRFPSNLLIGARAMASHMDKGGIMSDDIGAYITEQCENYAKLAGFVRYIRTNKLINEDSLDVFNIVRENIFSIRDDFKKLTGTKTYEVCSARIKNRPEATLNEEPVEALRDMFTVRKFDETFQDILPVVSKMVQEKDEFNRRIEESASNVVFVSPDFSNIAFDAINYDSQAKKVGHFVSEMAANVMENDELSDFMAKIGKSLCNEGGMNSFEFQVIQSVMSNLSRTSERAPDNTQPQEIKEMADYETALTNISYIFLV